MSGPLTGVRVLEFAGIGPVPFCGMLLADLGADVILIERQLPTGSAGEIADAGVLRRGRRSLVADLKRPEAVDVVLRLAREADVLIEGMRPGVAERLGIGPDECLATNPALVYGRMTGWGQDGPLACRAGHDLNYVSITGALHAIGGDDQPVPPLNLVGDFGGGAMFLAVGVLAGLASARSTGTGQVVDAAMYEGANLLMTMFWEQFAQGRWMNRRRSNVLDGGAPFNCVYRCADDRWLAVAPIEPQFRRELLTALGIDFDEADLGLNRERWPALRAVLTQTFAQRPRDTWMELLGESDSCVTPVLDFTEAPDHPQSRARRAFLPAREGVQPAPAPRFNGTPASDPANPPTRGIDTDAILDQAGYDAAARSLLRAVGAVS